MFRGPTRLFLGGEVHDVTTSESRERVYSMPAAARTFAGERSERASGTARAPQRERVTLLGSARGGAPRINYRGESPPGSPIPGRIRTDVLAPAIDLSFFFKRNCILKSPGAR